MKTFLTDISNVSIGVGLFLLLLVIGYFVFSFLTKFNDTALLREGNQAVGMYMGSKLLGLGIIIAMVSYGSTEWVELLIWSAVGMAFLCLVYLIFDFLTPRLDVCAEIAKGNLAVAELLRGIIIATSIVIGTFLL